MISRALANQYLPARLVTSDLNTSPSWVPQSLEAEPIERKKLSIKLIPKADPRFVACMHKLGKSEIIRHLQ